MFTEQQLVEDHARLLAWAEGIITRMPDFVIGPPHDPQVLRWYAIPRNLWMNVYVHLFLRSDDGVPHDHPWSSRSLILRNHYLEHFVDRSVTRYEGEVTEVRPAAAPHWIEVVDGHVLTLFQTGPIEREWGFHCPQGWRVWHEYVKKRDGGNMVGRGCGEQ